MVESVPPMSTFPEAERLVVEAFANVVCPVTTSDVAVRALRKEDAFA